MKVTCLSIFLIAAILFTANATVFEAATSEDVDLFLDDFQNETVGFLFYDSQVDNSKDENLFGKLSSKILGIFMSKDQFGRSTEDWIELFDDKLHLMRIDVRNKDNLRSREEFNIEDAPYIVLMDKRRTILREKVDGETFDHLKMLLDRRPNMKNKTGGAALKSFNLEPEAGAMDTKPRLVQFFDLENGAPTNVEAPVETQYVNWGPVDVIGPDGKWEERGRHWVNSYEIPESGIMNQKNSSLVHDVEKTNDDPRPQGSSTPVPRQSAPAKNATKDDSGAQGPPPLPQEGVQARLDAQRRREPTAQFQGRASMQGQQQVPLNDNGMPTRHPYHAKQYTGYGDIYSDHRKFQREYNGLAN